MTTREPAQQLESLARLAQAITGSFDLSELLDRVAQAATDIITDTAAGIWVAENERLVLRAEAGTLGGQACGPKTSFAFGEGLAGQVAVAHEPVILEDIRGDSRRVNREWLDQERYVSFIGMPLIAGDRFIGVLALLTRHMHAFTLQEIEVLGAFADHAAVALESARLHAATVRRGEELAALLRSARSLMAERDLGRALDRILEEAARISGTPNVKILLVDHATATLRLAAQRGVSAMPERFEMPLGEGLSGIVAQSGRSLYCGDSPNDPRNVLRDGVRRAGLRTYLGLPVVLAGEVLGVLSFVTSEARAYRDEELALLESFADHAALAIQNARLYAALERRLRRVQALSRLNQLISSSLDADRVLLEITRAAAELTEAAAVAFWLADERTRTLKIVAYSGAALADFPFQTMGFGEGVLGAIVAARRPIDVPDVFADARFKAHEWCRTHGLRSFLGVPVFVENSLIAVLALNAAHPFTEEFADPALLESFTAQAAAAIRNARLFATSERRRTTAESLAEVGRALAGSLEPDVVARQIAESVLALLGGQSAGLYRVAADGDLSVVTVAGAAASVLVPRTVLPRQHSMVGLAVREGGPVVTGNFLEDPRLAMTPEIRALLTPMPFRAVVAAPLTLGDRAIGALWVGDVEGRTFDAEDIRVVQTFADQAALALRNAELLHDARARQARLEALVEVSRQMSGLQPLPVVLGSIAEACGRVLDAPSVGFRLREGDDLVVVGSFGDAPDVARRPRVRIGESLSGLVAATGKPLQVRDFVHDSRILPEHGAISLRAGHRSWLGVPVMSGDRVLGVLNVRTPRPEGFSPSDEAIAAAFSAQAAVAIENARLYEEADRRRREAEALAALAKSLTETLDADAVGRRIAESVVQLFGARFSTVRLIQADGSLASIAWAGTAPTIAPEYRLPKGGGVSGRALAEGRAFGSSDMLHEPDLRIDPVLHAALEASGARASLAAPMRVKGDVIGALAIADDTGRVWDAADHALLQAFADEAALALQNARLYGESARRTLEAQIFADIVGAISATLDIAIVLQRVAEGARALCNSDVAAIALREPHEEACTVRYWSGIDGPVTLRVGPGRGAGGDVLQSGRPFRTDDYAADPRLVDAAALGPSLGIAALLVMPISIAGRVEGLLYVANRDPRVFSEHDERILSRLTEHAALAVQNLRLFAGEQAARAAAEAAERRLQTRIRQQEAVATLGQRALAGGDLGQIMDQVTALVAETLAVDFANTFELLPGGIEARLTATSGFPPTMPEGLTIGVASRSPVGVAIQSGEPVIVEELATDPRFAETLILRRLGVVSSVAVPIIGRAGTLGVLSAHATSRREFSRDDVHFLQAVGHVLAAALERQRADEALRASEEQLRQSQKMEAVGRLAGGVAHDFNNLLTIIIGRSQLLLRKLRPADPLRRDLDLIDKTATRASSLTRQLLAFSRKQVLQPTVLDLNAVVRGMASMLTRLLGEDMDLVIEAGHPLAPVKADRGQVEQVVVNLAVNARDAMPRGGRLTLRTANATLDAKMADRARVAPGAYVALSVIDTGTGMDEATLSRIFEPFFTTKGVGKGTGLGLSTVYGIVQQHQGSVLVNTAPGAGTTFTIFLPPTDEAPHEAEALTGGLRTGSETILLVEDEDEVRALAYDILHQCGYAVIEAPTVTQAIGICQRHPHPIHLLLTDVVMPTMSGPELAAVVTARRPAVKVLYMSGYTDDAIGPRGLASGVALLQKPFTPEALANRVREILDQSAAP